MLELREEFIVEDREKERFLARFEFTRDYENDFLEIANISVAASIVGPGSAAKIRHPAQIAVADSVRVLPNCYTLWNGHKSIYSRPNPFQRVSSPLKTRI